MVSFMCNPTTEEEVEEKDELKNQSFVVENNKANDPFDLALLEHEDFSLPFDDCFIDFDSIKDLIEEDSVVPYSMDALGASLTGTSVEKSDFEVVQTCIEMGGDGSCEKVNGEDDCFVRDEALKMESLGCSMAKKSDFGVNNTSVEMARDVISGKVTVEEKCFVKDESRKVESLCCLMQERSDFGVVEKYIDMDGDGLCERIGVDEKIAGDRSKELGDISCSIEEEMKKVSLDGVLDSSGSVVVYSGGEKDDGLVIGVGKDGRNGEIENSYSGIVKGDQLLCVAGAVSDNAEKSGDIVNVNADGTSEKVVGSDEDENDSESESESESSSSSSSSSSSESSSDEDEDEKEQDEESRVLKARSAKGRESGEVDGETDMEEGEIMTSDADDMIVWSENEDDEDDAGGNSVKGPVRSKNELTVLPPVPPANATLLPHHQILPIGVVSSIVGAQVIVEGLERHNPLNEGSILWVTERKSPLGLVDEIFGPVKNPYYIVRFNTESEVPAGIGEGTLVSFVPEFANHILNSESLYKKGYDASNENDEELSEDAEFSDDEKEAEYKRMLKMRKRGTNDEKRENKKIDGKKTRNRFGAGKRDQATSKQVQTLADKPPVDQSQQVVQPALASPCSDIGLIFANQPASGHPFPQLEQGPQHLNNVWANGIPCQQAFSGGLPPMQSMPWIQQNHPQQVYQAPFPNGVPFQQQINIGQTLPSNHFMLGGMSNFGAGPAFAPWLPSLAQNVPNQLPFGMGIQGQHAPTVMNVGENAAPSNGSQAIFTTNSGNNEAFRNFTPGVHRGSGRKSHCRGGGRLRGQRVWHQ